MPTLPLALVVIVPGLVSFLSNWFRSSTGIAPARWIDILIACVAIVILGVLAALSTGITHLDMPASLLLVAEYIAAVGKEFYDLLNYLLNTPSPLAPKARPLTRVMSAPGPNPV